MRQRLLLVDRCIFPGLFKVYSGTRVASFDIGIAPPAIPMAARTALAHVHAGTLPENALLRQIGATGFVTLTRCDGGTCDALRARFGEPAFEVAVADPASLGLPGGITIRGARRAAGKPMSPAGPTGS